MKKCLVQLAFNPFFGCFRAPDNRIQSTYSATNMYNFSSLFFIKDCKLYISYDMSHIYAVNVFFFQPEDHREFSNALKSMEELRINNFNGQSYGYIVYRKKMPIRQGAVLSMRGRPRDLLHVITRCSKFRKNSAIAASNPKKMKRVFFNFLEPNSSVPRCGVRKFSKTVDFGL